MSKIIVKPLKKSVCTWLCKQRVRKGYEIMGDEVITMTKEQLKEKRDGERFGSIDADFQDARYVEKIK